MSVECVVIDTSLLGERSRRDGEEGRGAVGSEVLLALGVGESVIVAFRIGDGEGEENGVDVDVDGASVATFIATGVGCGLLQPTTTERMVKKKMALYSHACW